MFNSTTKTSRERALEDELDGYRQAEEQRQREAEFNRARRRDEARQRYEEEMRSASDWREALGKQAVLCRRAHYQFPENEDDYFLQSANACDRALSIWNEVEAGRQVQMNDLKQQLAQIQDEIKNAVADRLEQENSTNAWHLVAGAIRDADPNAWLDW